MNLAMLEMYWWQIGVATLGLVFLLLPSGRRTKGKYQVVESAGAFAPGGCGLKVLGLALLGFAGWRLYQDYWLVHHPRIPSDIADWHPVSLSDGAVSARFPVPAVETKGATGEARTGAVGESVQFALVRRTVSPGFGFLQAKDLTTFYQGLAAVPAQTNLDHAQVIRQEPIRTGTATGTRLGVDLPGGLRFYVQSYRVADRLYAVSMCAPASQFENGTAQKFFDSVSIRDTPPSTTPAPGVAAPSRRLSSGTSPKPAGKETERRFGPKPGVKGVGDK